MSRVVRHRRLVLAAAGLCSLALSACGDAPRGAQHASVPAAAKQAPLHAVAAAHAEQRPAIEILSPGPGDLIKGEQRGRDLTAVVRVVGHAAPGQQLEILGTCGTIECDSVAFADRRGRWRTELQLTAAGGSRQVHLRAAYADPTARDRTARVLLRLGRPVHRAAPPEASARIPARGPRPVVVIGDSLALGMSPYLRGQLTGWPMSVDARIGRPLAEGLHVIESTPMPSGHPVLAVSLFTNDSPGNVNALDAAVREAVSLVGPGGCVLWATISRPPLYGVSYATANARLHDLAADPRLAGRLVVVPWAEAVRRHPEWHVRDKVHATGTGYAAMGQLFADAARSCPA